MKKMYGVTILRELGEQGNTNYDTSDRTSLVPYSQQMNVSTGIQSNQANWNGSLAVSNYRTLNPVVISRRPNDVNYVQDVNVRYLKPTSPAPQGDIIVRQQPTRVIEAAPPIIIRQSSTKPKTPSPVVYREAPPQQPQLQVEQYVVPGKVIAPAPRRVVIERLPEPPVKPQQVYIDRWLPYGKIKRKVILQRPPEPVIVKPKNLLIQWQQPDIRVEKELYQHGVYQVNPAEYALKYGAELKAPNELPNIALKVPPPQGQLLAIDAPENLIHKLEGDIGALALVDLDKVGLGKYKAYLAKYPVPPRIDYVDPTGNYGSGVNKKKGFNPNEYNHYHPRSEVINLHPYARNGQLLPHVSYQPQLEVNPHQPPEVIEVGYDGKILNRTGGPQNLPPGQNNFAQLEQLAQAAHNQQFGPQQQQQEQGGPGGQSSVEQNQSQQNSQVQQGPPSLVQLPSGLANALQQARAAQLAQLAEQVRHLPPEEQERKLAALARAQERAQARELHQLAEMKKRARTEVITRTVVRERERENDSQQLSRQYSRSQRLAKQEREAEDRGRQAEEQQEQEPEPQQEESSDSKEE